MVLFKKEFGGLEGLEVNECDLIFGGGKNDCTCMRGEYNDPEAQLCSTNFSLHDIDDSEDCRIECCVKRLFFSSYKYKKDEPLPCEKKKK